MCPPPPLVARLVPRGHGDGRTAEEVPRLFFFGQDLARLFLARLFLAAYRKKKSLELIDLWAARGGKCGSAASGTGRTALAWPIPASSADAAAGSAGNWARSSSVASCPSINRGGQRGGGSGSGAGTSWLPAGGCSRSSARPQSPHVEPLLFAGPFPAGFLPSLPYGDGTDLPLCRGAISSDPAPLLGGTALFP